MKMKNEVFDVDGNILNLNEYTYGVYAKDKILSGWGDAEKL